MEQKSYYAIIPATVRYDRNLPDGAKLLYGEITALCNEKGFCWAGNQYFADLYGKSVSSIKRWIGTLEEHGYIIRNFRYKEGSKEIDERCISIRDTPVQKCPEVGSKIIRPPVQKWNDPRCKNEPDNITVNNTEEYIPPTPAEENEGKQIDYPNHSKLCEMVFNSYNETCKSFPRLTRISDARKKAIIARARTGYLYADFQQLFKMAESSDFLKGKNSRNWSANFDWLIKDSNMAKVLDGNYSENAPVAGATQKSGIDWSGLDDQ